MKLSNFCSLIFLIIFQIVLITVDGVIKLGPILNDDNTLVLLFLLIPILAYLIMIYVSCYKFHLCHNVKNCIFDTQIEISDIYTQVSKEVSAYQKYKQMSWSLRYTSFCTDRQNFLLTLIRQGSPMGVAVFAFQAVDWQRRKKPTIFTTLFSPFFSTFNASKRYLF